MILVCQKIEENQGPAYFYEVGVLMPEDFSVIVINIERYIESLFKKFFILIFNGGKGICYEKVISSIRFLFRLAGILYR